MAANTLLSRRQIMQFGALGGLGLLAAGASPAWSATRDGALITDLGPGVVQFGSKSAVQIGDIMYVGSRNIEPTYAIAFDLNTRKVIGQAAVPGGRSIQGIDGADEDRWLYFAIENGTAEHSVFRWDRSNPQSEPEPLGRAGTVIIWTLSVSPDGVAYFAGRENGPNLWSYDPAVGAVQKLGTPEPTATGVRTVLATDTTVYFGSGTVLDGGAGTAKAVLSAYDRASGRFTDILPAELAQDANIRDLRLAGDRLVVGTTKGAGTCHIAVLDLADPSSYRVVETPGVTTKAMFVHEETVFFVSQANSVQMLDLSTMQIRRLEVPGVDFGEVWGMGWHDGGLQVVSAYGFIAHVDVAARTATLTDLIEAGAPAEAQLAMSVTAGGGFVYVSANSALARHRLDSGAVQNLAVPGEAKDAEYVDGLLYMGQYSALGLYGYDPASDALPQQLAPLPVAYNRPQSVAWDECTRRVVITAKSDSLGGACVGVHNPADGSMAVVIDPFGIPADLPASAARDGIVYIGANNTPDGRGRIMAFDPLSRTARWTIDALPAGVFTLATRGAHLYASLTNGSLVVIDIPRRRIVHSADLRAISPKGSSLVTARGRVYGLSTTTLYALDHKTFQPRIVVPDLVGAWYGGQLQLAADENGSLYTMRDRNLVRIEDRAR